MPNCPTCKDLQKQLEDYRVQLAEARGRLERFDDLREWAARLAQQADAQVTGPGSQYTVARDRLKPAADEVRRILAALDNMDSGSEGSEDGGGGFPPDLVAALERVPIGAVKQDRAILDALASRFPWPYPDDPFTMATRLCDEDGVVRKGAMHHGTDYPCTGHAHFSGEHIICTNPVHWRDAGVDSGSEGEGISGA